GEKLEAELRALLQQTGVDFEREVVGSLGGGIITQLWPAAPDQPTQTHTALLLDLHAGNRLGEAVTKLCHGRGLRPSTATVLGKRVYRLAVPFAAGDSLPLAYIGENHAALASSTAAMEQVLGLLAEAPENKAVQELLGKLPGSATSVSWT